MGAYPLSALSMLVAALLNICVERFTGVVPWLTAIAALAFSIISPLLFIFEFILGLEFVGEDGNHLEVDVVHVAQARNWERDATAHSERSP